MRIYVAIMSIQASFAIGQKQLHTYRGALCVHVERHRQQPMGDGTCAASESNRIQYKSNATYVYIAIARTDSVTVGLAILCSLLHSMPISHRLAGWVCVCVCDAVSIENWIKQSQTAFTLINIKFFCIALTRTCTLCSTETGCTLYALALPIGVFKP